MWRSSLTNTDVLDFVGLGGVTVKNLLKRMAWAALIAILPCALAAGQTSAPNENGSQNPKGSQDGQGSSSATPPSGTAAGPKGATPIGTQTGTLTGIWTGAFDYQGSRVPLTLHLTADNGAVTGSIEGLPTSPTEIHDGKIDSGKVSFWANTDYQGQTYKLIFNGEASSAPGRISFTLGTEDGSWSTSFLARKSTGPPAVTAADTPDVTGTWKGSFDFQGRSIPVTMHLTGSGQSVTGTVEGMMESAPEKSIDIHDGKLDGAMLTFWLNTDYQGESYRIVYTGNVANGKIAFTFGTDDGSWSSDLVVAK